MIAAIRGHLPSTDLYNYRRGGCKLPGHPELGLTPGIEFSSGRLGHMWPFVNGVAMANPGKVVICLGSDGAQQEGNDDEAARLAVAKNLNVKLLIDDNDITITGHPSDYLPGFDCLKNIQGHGMDATSVDAENLEKLFIAVRNAIVRNGPSAVVSRRKMSPGIEGIEGTHVGHDVIPAATAIEYLTKKGYTKAAEVIKQVPKAACPVTTYLGSGEIGSMRSTVGATLVEIMGKLSKEDRIKSVMAIDSDLGSSTSLNQLQKAFPEIYCHSGIMERGNFSAAAGFGMTKGKQGIFSTFGAFLEMIVSEITMARLNFSNVLCHFSHCGVDDMADNTCHFGINQFFADNGLSDGYETKLYFPCDAHQVKAVLNTIYTMNGLRFLFTTRSKTPAILKENGELYYGPGYTFVPGKDEIIRTGSKGYIVSFGDCVYRALDAVEKLKKEGIDVGLVNKPTLNTIDEDCMKTLGASPFVLVVEPLNTRTGLGMRLGTQFLLRNMAPKYAHIGVHREGEGGLWEHAFTQKYDSDSVIAKVKEMIA